MPPAGLLELAHCSVLRYEQYAITAAASACADADDLTINSHESWPLAKRILDIMATTAILDNISLPSHWTAARPTTIRTMTWFRP